MNPETIQRFEYIRTTFFPRWDRAHEWTVGDNHPNCGGFGYCDTEGKQIIVKPDSPHGRDVTLIHEITHAVTSIYHGKKWQSRLFHAALKAEEIGRNDLADEIRKDYKGYSDSNRSFKPTAAIVYNQVEDAVLSAQGKLSFEEVIESVSNGNGMTSKMLLTKYKKLRVAYDEALIVAMKIL
jgi:hypothetical protein